MKWIQNNSVFCCFSPYHEYKRKPRRGATSCPYKCVPRRANPLLSEDLYGYFLHGKTPKMWYSRLPWSTNTFCDTKYRRANLFFFKLFIIMNGFKKFRVEKRGQLVQLYIFLNVQNFSVIFGFSTKNTLKWEETSEVFVLWYFWILCDLVSLLFILTLVLLRVFPKHIFLRGVVATPLGLSILNTQYI